MTDIVSFQPVRAVDANGDPASGAEAYFYLSGTTTPATVYSDEDETTAHPSPLVADSSGVFAAVYRSGVALKVNVTDSAGVTLPGFPVDPVITVSATGSGASEVSFSPTADIPKTNVQDAIEKVQDNLVEPLLAGGIGVTGNATELSDIDATNTASGFYRWTATSTGTFPTGWSGETGIIYLLRETSGAAVQVIYRRDNAKVFKRRMESSTWGAWDPGELTKTQVEDDTDTTFGTVSGERLGQAVATQALGVGQTWQDVSASRSENTEYQNTTGKPIMISVQKGGGAFTGIEISTGSVSGSLDVVFSDRNNDNNSRSREGGAVIIPDQWYYSVDAQSTGFFRFWELR